MPRFLAATLVSVLIVSGCVTSNASPDPGSNRPIPTASPDMTITPATASPIEGAASASPEPDPTASPSVTPTPAVVPPKPTGVTFHEEVRELSGGRHEITYTVTWQEPRTEGYDVLVSGVTKCLSKPSNPPAPSNGACLVVHTPLPSSVRKLIAGAPATDGAISWTWPVVSECSNGWEMIGPDGTWYAAVVLAAYNGPEHSIFAIAQPGSWNVPAPGDIVC